MDVSSTSMYEQLRPVIRAEHVAVIGASSTEGKAGNRLLQHLKLHGYEGRISPVNPSGGEIEGLTCYPAVGDIPETVDCAIVLTPLGASVEAVRACADAGVRACVLGGVGFAELGTDEGRTRQAQIRDIAEASGMRMIGPNTNGFINRDIGLALGYNTAHGEPIAKGVISVAAHTGAMFIHFSRRLAWMKGGMSKFISVGNEIDISLLDCLEYFLDDDNSKVIGLIIEGVNDGERFRRLLARARDIGKPVVVLKLGRSKAGAGASLAHATRLAGNGRAYDALFEDSGAAVVPSIESFTAGCRLLAERSPQSVLGDQRLICVSSSGAGAAMLADLAESRALPMAVGPDGNWDAPLAAALTEIKTNQVTHNPLDTGSLGGREKLTQVLNTAADHGVTGPLIGLTHTVGGNMADESIANTFIERKNRTGTPTIMIAPSSLIAAIEDLMIDNGILVFRESGTAFDAIKCHYATLPNGGADSPPTPAPRPSARLNALAAEATSPVLDEVASTEILAEIGLPVVPNSRVISQADATKAAAELGYPVVLKAVAPGVAHKNDLGFVEVGIASPKALSDAIRNIKSALKANKLGPQKTPLILQPMISAKAELILGVTREVGLGHFLIVGLGGIYAEALDETLLLPVPSSPDVMRSKIAASRLGRLIASIDRDGGSIMDSVTDALNALQGLIAAHGDVVEAVDINPFLIGPARCVAVDALVVLAN